MYLEYDFSAYENAVFERVKTVIELFQKLSIDSVAFWQELPAWAQAGFIDLSKPEQRFKSWGKREMLNLDDPQDRAAYDRFRLQDTRWDWESWLAPLQEGFWKPDINDVNQKICVVIDEFPSGVIGPLNYLVEIAGASDSEPEIVFSPLKEPTP
ncbi:hypothetical protein ACFP81_09085 [Deinococcus lacus]|uniref:Uncharacterized protein n=1 Tax=Deinococcus lacus TaxID=392561 RepID=A0ABW1YD24_9DEIO